MIAVLVIIIIVILVVIHLYRIVDSDELEKCLEKSFNDSPVPDEIVARPIKYENTLRVSRLECVKPDWKRVLNAARRTVGKKPIDKEPSVEFKKEILLAEHSPIRLLEYDFTWEDIKQWITVHIARHHQGCEKFIHSQRTDRNELLEGLNRDDLRQGLLNDMDMTCNAQSFINISRKRLCKCASKETRQAWELVIEYLKEVDPILAEKCVPECVYRGFCPEKKRCCGYVNTKAYQKRLIKYRSFE